MISWILSTTKVTKIYYILIFLVLYIILVVRLLLSLTAHFFGCFSPYELEVLLLPFTEKWVLKHEAVILLFYFVKIIHVELILPKKYLTNKGGEVGVPEIFGKDLSGEWSHIVYNKSDITFIPWDGPLVLGMLGLNK